MGKFKKLFTPKDREDSSEDQELQMDPERDEGEVNFTPDSVDEQQSTKSEEEKTLHQAMLDADRALKNASHAELPMAQEAFDAAQRAYNIAHYVK